MKLKTGFILRNICDSYVVVAVGSRATEHRGMIKLNETGAFLWKKLEQDRTREDLVRAMVAEYEVDEATAGEGIDGFLKLLQESDLLA